VKRTLAALMVGGTSLLGFVVAAPAANAADCPSGTVLQVHVHGNINGTPVDQDVCLPPSS
jgi:hypothetical protein